MRTLAEELERDRQLSVARAVELGLALLDRLAAEHAAGRVHGAVQPAAVQVDGALIAGVAPSADHAAPDPDPSPAGDLYAAGCTLFECLAGRPPFVGGSEAELASLHRTAEPPPLQRFAPEAHALAPVIARLLRKAAAERYASAVEARAALESAWMESTARTAKPAPRDGRTISATPRSKGGGTQVAARGAGRQVGRSAGRQVGRMRNLALAGLVLALVIGAWALHGRAAAIEDPAITFGAGGALEVSWRTRRALEGRVELVPLGGGEGRERQVADAQPTRQHALELTGLQPGRDYALVVRSGGHAWTAAVNVPARPPLELMPARGGARVRLPDPGGRFARATLVDGAPLPGQRENDAWVWDLPRAPAAIEAGAYAEVALDGQTLRYRLRTAGELGMDLADALEKFDPAPIVQRVVDDPQFDARYFRQSVASLLGAGEVAPEPARRAPRRAGHFKDPVVAVLKKQAWHADLEAFRPLAGAFFAAATPLAHRRRLHGQLTRLEVLDILLRGQGEPEGIGVRALSAGFVDVAYSVVPEGPAPADPAPFVPLLESPTAWYTKDYNQQGALAFWVKTSDFFAALFPGDDVSKGIVAVNRRFKHLRTGPPVEVDGSRGATAHLRLRVAKLAGDHYFEVRLRGEDDLLLLATHPGTRDWDVTAGDQPVRWGQIDIRFPAALLPRPPLRAELTYKNPPGVASAKMSGQLPTAYVGAAALAVLP